jgi:hypothetical protein
VKLLLTIALVVIAAWGIGYVYLHRQELGLVRAPGAEAVAGGEPGAQPALIRWEKVDRRPDGFSVEIPTGIKDNRSDNRIRDTQVPAYNDRGGSDQVNMIFSDAGAETTFSVAWADDPPVAQAPKRSLGGSPKNINQENILEMARDGALVRTQTLLVGESRYDLGGFPGLEFSARNESGGVMNARLIYARPRLYMLTSAFPSASARRDADVARFFSSFAVVSSANIPENAPPPPANR